MNWADWAILGITLISILIGAGRGFIKEALSVTIWVAAIIIASVFDERMAVWLVDAIATPSLRLLAAWASLFVAVLLVGSLVNFLLGKLVEATGLSGTDRLLGVLFGLARGLIIVMVLLILLPEILPVEQDIWWQESTLIPYFLGFEDWARDAGAAIADFFQQFF